jgi:basic membrane protein A and related proteins
MKPKNPTWIGPIRFPVKFRIFHLLTLLLLLTACTPPEVDCARSDVYCVGLVTDTGGLQDYGLTQSAWEGIQKALADGVIQKADYIESVDALDYAKNLSTFAEMKYDVIVASGVSLEDETLQAADLYPDPVFIGLDQAADSSRKNFLAVNFPEDQGGFLAGALAASMTETGVIGAACETAGIPSNWRTCEGFRAGAAYIDPEITVLVTYRENGHREDLFRDEAWGRDTALEMIADGVDVLFGVGGGTGEGALVAAAQAGAWTIGSEQDQFEVQPEVGKFILTSVTPDAGPSLYEALSQIPSKLPASPLMGVMRLSSYHEAERFISLPIQQNLIQLENALGNGGISTGVKPEEPQ